MHQSGSDNPQSPAGQPLPESAATIPPTAHPKDGACPCPTPAATANVATVTLAPAASGPAAPGQGAVPGYELLRELGRGGMGVVYQARQLKLNRTVALKMILAGAHAGEQDLARFLVEAEAVAQLQHPNIVQLYEYGQHDQLPYFTLELVAGGSLADKLRAGPLQPREAARLTEQLARGMVHAHEQGIVHRDLKPPNVLVAGDGTPKITDFGLARRLEVGSRLTATGAVLGTPSYMAPEQAGGQRVGPAADVYALGAILYECLTGRPPFQGPTPLDTLLQVVSEEPVPLRRLQPKIPRDLETLCLKCLRKEPHKRYGSMVELAEDLRRFGAGEPVRARPVGRAERLARWVRRRPAAAAAVALFVVLLAGVVGGLLWYQQLRVDWAEERAQFEADQVRREAEDSRRLAERQAQQKYLGREVSAAMADAERVRADLAKRLSDPLLANVLLSDLDQWQGLLAATKDTLRRAEALADSNPGLLDKSLAARLQALKSQLLADEAAYRLARKLDDIRLEASTLVEGKVNDGKAAPEYARVFREAALDPRQGEPGRLAAAIRRSPARYALVAALDHWAQVARQKELTPRLLEVARLADPDPWRDQVRAPKFWLEKQELERLARSADVSRQSPQVLASLAWRLYQVKGEALPLARAALVQYPRDFWLHFNSGNICDDPLERAGYFRAALAVRPQSSVAHFNLANALYSQMGYAPTSRKDLAGAIRHYRKAVQLDPRHASALTNLGHALADKHDWKEAIRHYHQSLQIDPNLAMTHHLLGQALNAQGDREEAIRCYHKALHLQPNYVLAHNSLGDALREKKDLPGAIEHFQKAAQLDPTFVIPRYNLGVALYDKGEVAAAISHFQKALQLEPNYAPAHLNLGVALYSQGKVEDARRHLNKALELEPKNALIYVNLGTMLYEKGDQTGAVEHFRKALQLDPKIAMAHHNLGDALRLKGDLEGAIDHFEKALQLDPGLAAKLAPRLAEVHVNLGTHLYNRGKFDVAVRHYQKALQFDSKDALIYANLGNTLRAKGDLEGAGAYYKKSLQLDPNNAPVHNNMGLVLASNNDWDSAIKHWRKACQLQPNYGLAHANLGSALHAKGDLEGAIHHYTRAVQLGAATAAQITPRLARAHGALGAALADRGDLDGAIDHLRIALQLEPNNGLGQVALAAGLVARKDWDGTINHARKAVQLVPKVGEAHGLLGWALLEKGQFTEAQQALEKALQLLPPGNFFRPAFQQNLERCRQLLQQEQQGAAILEGKTQPSNPSEQLQLADLYRRYKKSFAVAVRFYAGAFAANPALADDLNKGHRYHAASAAVLAATSQPQEESVRLRRQALDWLKADLERLRKKMSPAQAGGDKGLTGDPAEVAWGVDKLSAWQTNPELASVREDKELARWPEEERKAWKQLWADAAQLLQQGRAGFRETQLHGRLTVPKRTQVHDVKLMAGRTYVLDLRSRQFDTFLRLEDASGKKLAEDDDSAGDLDARIVFTAPQDATYRVVATSRDQLGLGNYTLIVREFAGKK